MGSLGKIRVLASRAEWRHETAYGGYQARQQPDYAHGTVIILIILNSKKPRNQATSPLGVWFLGFLVSWIFTGKYRGFQETRTRNSVVFLSLGKWIELTGIGVHHPPATATLNRVGTL